MNNHSAGTMATNNKREQILQAAATVFAAKGFSGARVSDIAKRAKVADGTIYLYFKSKDDILVALFALAMSQFLDRARNELASLHGAEASLHDAKPGLEARVAFPGAPASLASFGLPDFAGSWS